MDPETAKLAARQTGLSLLATLRESLGSLDRVVRVVKSLVIVNAVPEFTDHIRIANGYSELLRDVFGASAGVGARSAVGMGSLPSDGIPVEIELIVEITSDALDWIPHAVINCCGNFTSLGGSRMHPKAMRAIEQISTRFVDINTLARSGGERIAKLARLPEGSSVLE